jgi:hypothetical protein
MKIKIVKSVKLHVISGVVSYKSGLIYKILRGMNTSLYGVFVFVRQEPARSLCFSVLCPFLSAVDI